MMNNREAITLLRNLEDSLDSYCELNEEGKTTFCMAIESLELFGNSEHLPSAQPEPHWTPCSEGMPKKSGPYFVTNYEYGERVTGINIYSVDCGGWLHDLDEPVAWMPLPDPYGGESDGNN